MTLKIYLYTAICTAVLESILHGATTDKKTESTDIVAIVVISAAWPLRSLHYIICFLIGIGKVLR